MNSHDLLKELENRPRVMDRDVALEPAIIQRIVASLDAQGASEVGDVIHSLLWRNQILNNRAQRFAKELCEPRGAEHNQLNADRYQHVRKLSPRQFTDIWELNVAGKGAFDDLVDADIVKKQGW